MKTDDLDEAFVLFDSQNTRGKPLKRKDILKVHHIHSINNKRQIIAKKWEEWEKDDKENLKGEIDRLDRLLYLLALIRLAIRGELNDKHLNYIDVFKEFFAKTTSYKLNYYNQPPIYEEFKFDFENNLLELITKPIKFNNKFIHNGNRFLPFEINSSISRGEMFFEYVYKYFDFYKIILENEWYKKLDNVYGKSNLFLQKIYKALIFYYVDKFGDENLEEFAKNLLVILAYYRLTKDSIRADGVVKFKWNGNDKLDIFKLITLSYSNEEVINTLKEYIEYQLEKNMKMPENGVKDSFINNIENLIKDKLCQKQS